MLKDILGEVLALVALAFLVSCVFTWGSIISYAVTVAAR